MPNEDSVSSRSNCFIIQRALINSPNPFRLVLIIFPHCVFLSQTDKKIPKIMKNRRVLWIIVTCHVVIITQQLSGVNTMIFYATVIFNNGGSGDLTGSEQTLVVGVVQIVSCLLCTGLIDFLGRRVLLTVSAALTGLFMILLGKTNFVFCFIKFVSLFSLLLCCCLCFFFRRRGKTRANL